MSIGEVSAESLRFGVLNAERVRRLSVAKVTSAQTFDALGHPLPGGLCDPAMGPSERETCASCSGGALACPGHFGHIELPRPVVNPLFQRHVLDALRVCCLRCYRVQADRCTLDLLARQLRLLEAGRPAAALEIEAAMLDADDASAANVGRSDSLLDADVDEPPPPDADERRDKDFDKLRNRFVMNVVRKALLTRNCKFCKEPILRPTMSDGRIMCHTSTTAGKQLKILMPDEMSNSLINVWETDSSFIKEMLPFLKRSTSAAPVADLFCDIILVIPPLVRPCNMLRGQLIEHPQTMVYKGILVAAFAVRAILKVISVKKNEKDEKISAEVLQAYNGVQGKEPLEKLHYAWQEMQKATNNLLSCSSDVAGGQGLKQIIEKKAGVIRMHMMGKRVNFAARSVITPDPNVDVDEIGVPEAIALKLTYPVPVTPFNADELRRMVINGPDVHPGAVAIESGGRVVRIPADSRAARKSLAKRLLTPDETKKIGSKVVRRHLVNGDALLLNRQPTLHKPSIMAHRARVLKGEKTLRMHYANCKSYNADFDGDEMNAHFPQNELGRSEAYNIMTVDEQYLVPKDGTPLGGLIQDHIIAGVKMTVRGKFFSEEDYRQIVYQAFARHSVSVKLLPPALIKPARLWSGKQVISTVILNCIPPGKEAIQLYSKAKIPCGAWQTRPGRAWHEGAGGAPCRDPAAMTESEVVIRRGELLCGVLDKMHYGSTPYGLIHCAYELYGGRVSSAMLTAFSRVFTLFLQWEGFTLGVEDILIESKADRKRLQCVEAVRGCGAPIASAAVDLPPDTDTDDLGDRLEDSYGSNPRFRSIIDRKYKAALDKHTNAINKCCLPAGLVKKFPLNNLQLMVISGAKGSTVNTMQISCLLGQIELEGKRPPLMISGKSLPSFLPYETSPRSGGFVDGRFMTGIRPQEFFYHCMAGREGLIDTAVKTSRSGYLQRCLIKHLEGVSVRYDRTVRDSDDSIVQFAYGEDGMDVCKSQFLNEKQFDFLYDNRDAVYDETVIDSLSETCDRTHIDRTKRALYKWQKKRSNAETVRISPFSKFCRVTIAEDGEREARRRWFALSRSERASYYDKRCPDPLASSCEPIRQFGAIGEKLDRLMRSYLKKRRGENAAALERFTRAMELKASVAQVAPGEAVGLLAAQSIGEPSTQMTLNTFHFAGRGDMNVTLGIPRLREILMMASAKPKTPSVDVPFLANVADLNAEAERLRQKLTRVTLAEVLERIQVDCELKTDTREFVCELTFIFLPKAIVKSQFMLKPVRILKHVEKKYFTEMFATMKKMARAECGVAWATEGGSARGRRAPAADDLSSDEELADQDDDTTQVKSRQRHNEAQEYEDPESEEEEKSDVETDEPTDLENADEGFGEGSDDSHSANVTKAYTKATNYQYDKTHGRWCRLTTKLPIALVKVDLSAALKESASRSVIREAKNIRRAITYSEEGALALKTDGVNILQMFEYDRLLDLKRLYSDDVHGVARIYGIEAAARVVVREIQSVFGAYGIAVDSRHLSLVADYMTRDGRFEPLNRKGMDASSSPLQQMSFESSLLFLREAALACKADALASASARLMLAKPCRTGTGAFAVFLDPKAAAQ